MEIPIQSRPDWCPDNVCVKEGLGETNWKKGVTEAFDLALRAGKEAISSKAKEGIDEPEGTLPDETIPNPDKDGLTTGLLEIQQELFDVECQTLTETLAKLESHVEQQDRMIELVSHATQRLADTLKEEPLAGVELWDAESLIGVVMALQNLAALVGVDLGQSLLI